MHTASGLNTDISFSTPQHDKWANAEEKEWDDEREVKPDVFLS